ncbi:hypothetical protein [Polyangium jinanense]|uniref:Uncharacterized protein n=1 Tax=Polyangium jinanense TaxID=2829994 RepID=A0A9X4AUD6_9BACT|nr:hypothetical protein [Polyangium jinanense]MDC3955932.1 hypothetical protein [Polyangium jinanense]MDC3985129.1 hypothetical protein [Polyangium jinanense]
MRFVLLAQVAGAALFLAGCPGDQQVEPSGGNGCPAGQVCPPGAGGGGNGGNGGDGAGGAGNGTAQGGSGQGGAGNGGAGGAGNNGGSGGAGNNGAGGNGSGGAGNNGAGGGTGGTGGNAAVCEPLEADVNLKLVPATKCYPQQPEIPQCQEIIDGPCCPISVVAQDLPEVIAYKEALQKFKNESCEPAECPLPCPAMPQFKCTADQGDPTTGTCTPVTP